MSNQARSRDDTHQSRGGDAGPGTDQGGSRSQDQVIIQGIVRHLPFKNGQAVLAWPQLNHKTSTLLLPSLLGLAHQSGTKPVL
jgi:hypothetical protein